MFDLVVFATVLAVAALPVIPQDQRQWGQESSCGTTSLSSICEFYRPGEPGGDRRRLDSARFAGGLVQGAGSTVGFALLFPGQALQVLGGPAEDLGFLLAGSGALASWGTAHLGDAIRLFEVAPD